MKHAAGILPVRFPGTREDRVDRAGQTGRDRTEEGGDQRAAPQHEGNGIDRRPVAARGQDRDALSVLHHQHGDRERDHQFDHRLPGELRHVEIGLGKFEQRAGRRIERSEQPDRDRTDDQRDDQRRRNRARSAAKRSTRRTPRSSTARSRSRRGKACTRSMPKRRNTPATIAITIGIGIASITRRTKSGQAEHQHQQAGREERADHFRKGEMRQRRSDQHRARNASRRTPAAAGRAARRQCVIKPVAGRTTRKSRMRDRIPTARRAHRPTG